MANLAPLSSGKQFVRQVAVPVPHLHQQPFTSEAACQAIRDPLQEAGSDPARTITVFGDKVEHRSTKSTKLHDNSTEAKRHPAPGICRSDGLIKMVCRKKGSAAGNLSSAEENDSLAAAHNCYQNVAVSSPTLRGLRWSTAFNASQEVSRSNGINLNSRDRHVHCMKPCRTQVVALEWRSPTAHPARIAGLMNPLH